MNGTFTPAAIPAPPTLSALAMSGFWRVGFAVAAVLLIWGAVDWALS